MQYPWSGRSNTAAAILSIGDDWQKYGLLKEKEQADAAADARKQEREMAVMRERMRLERENKALEVDDKIRTEDARFERLKPLLGERPTEDKYVVGVDDESGGHSAVDQKRFDKDTQKWKDDSLFLRSIAMNPNAADDVQKALTTRTTRESVYGAEDDRQLIEAGKRVAAIQAKPRMDIKGDTEYDPYDPNKETSPTDIGEARGKNYEASARANDARAAESRADAARKGQDAKIKANDPRYKALEKQYENAEKEANSIRTRLEEKRTKNKALATEGAYKDEVAQLETALEKAEQRKADLITRMDEFTKDGPGAPPPRGGKTNPLDAYMR